VRHAVPEHAYGAQSIVFPFGEVSVCMPLHEAASFDTHLPVIVLHVNIPSQSASLAHVEPHASPRQAKGVHEIVAAPWHAPFPSQVPARFAMPFAHDGARHVVWGPTRPAHDVRVTPSHAPAVHALPPVAPGHAPRFAAGAPLTPTHVPSVGATLHASQSPWHAESQQTPSTQKPEPQSLPNVQLRPLLGLHVPPRSQTMLPVHVSGSGALVTVMHTPGFEGSLHRSQVPHVAASQHAPSVQ
jgi:hypothetical protein